MLAPSSCLAIWSNCNLVGEVVKLLLSPRKLAQWEYAEHVHVQVHCDNQIFDLATAQSRVKEKIKEFDSSAQ